MTGKRALVTGGASGIGRATAELFAREGARVAITDRSVGGAEEVAAVLGRDVAHPFAADITDEAQVAELVSSAASWLGGLDIVVNSAGVGGVGTPKALADVDLDTWRATIDTNLTGTYLVTRFALPHLLDAGGGAIVNLASTYAIVAGPKLAAYSASKAGIVQLTRTVAADYAGDGVRANAIAPGFVDTPMLRADIAKEPDPDAALAAVLERIPQGTLMTPEQVARAILFLASDEAEIVTGSLLVADGGFTAL